MKIMKKRSSSPKTALCLALASAFVLSACSSAANAPTTAAPAAAAEPTSTAAPAPEPTAAPDGGAEGAGTEAAALSGEIVYYSMWTEDEAPAKAWKAIADDFMAQYPGTTVTFNFVGRDLSKTLKPTLEAGTTVDMFDYPTQYGKDLGIYLADLTEVVTRPFDVLGGKSITDVVIPSMLDKPKQQLEIDTIQPALGYRPWLQLIMYNADILAQAGVTAAPATWEELDAICAQILDTTGIAPLTFDSAYSLWIPGMYLERLKGEEWVKSLVADDTGALWDDPAVLQMAKAMEDFAKKGYFEANVATNAWPAGQQDVALGKAAMYYNLSGLVGEVAETAGPDFNWGGFVFPNVAGSGTDRMSGSATGATMTAINRNSANLDLAYEFLAFSHADSSDAHFVENGIISSSKTGTYPPQLEALKPAFESVSEVLSTGGGIESDADLKAVLIASCTKLLAGQVTAEEFVAEVKAVAATGQ